MLPSSYADSDFPSPAPAAVEVALLLLLLLLLSSFMRYFALTGRIIRFATVATESTPAAAYSALL